MKKLMSLTLAALILFACVPAVLAEQGGMFDKPVTMYVYTDDGGRLNVRSEPRVTKSNLIGRLDYGTKVSVLGEVVINSDWVIISYKKGENGIGYVQRRYLSAKKPGANPKDKQKAEEDAQRKKDLAELNRQLASARNLKTPLMLVVRPARVSGWVNFRVGPGVAASRISSLPDGYELQAIGETDKWYQAVDPKTGKTGYISKNYVTVLTTATAAPVVLAKEQMGTLNVNGQFALQCKLPDGYQMQVINQLGEKLTAFISANNNTKPILQLSIAFNELYSDVERMNNLSKKQLQELEATFKDMNDVKISYAKTSHGTKLLVAREVGEDADFVDILTVYKGYSIEFVMTPNPRAKTQTLNDKQVQMCIDFLSELDFVPAA